MMFNNKDLRVTKYLITEIEIIINRTYFYNFEFNRYYKRLYTRLYNTLDKYFSPIKNIKFVEFLKSPDKEIVITGLEYIKKQIKNYENSIKSR